MPATGSSCALLQQYIGGTFDNILVVSRSRVNLQRFQYKVKHDPNRPVPPGDGHPGAPAVPLQIRTAPPRSIENYSQSNQFYTQLQGSRATYRHDRASRCSPCPPGFRGNSRKCHGPRSTNKPGYTSQISVAPGRDWVAFYHITSFIYRFVAGAWMPSGADRARSQSSAEIVWSGRISYRRAADQTCLYPQSRFIWAAQSTV